VTASQFLRVRTPKTESRARRTTETLEVALILKNIRQRSWTARPFAKRCENAQCVTNSRREKIKNVSKLSA